MVHDPGRDALPADPPQRPAAPGVGFGEAFRFWLKLGFISFGGPAGQIAIMHRELVERRRWISEGRFLHALNYCMLLPGPEAQQLATYIGWLLHRVRGGIVAGALFVLPSIFVLLALSFLYALHGTRPAVAAALYGVRPIVVAIVLEAVLRIGRRAVRGPADLAIALAAFVAIYLLDVPFPLIVLAAAGTGWLLSRLRPAAGARPAPSAPEAADPPRAIDDALPPAPHTRPSRRRFLIALATGLAIWLAGYALLAALRGTDSLHAHEYRFFTQAAFLTFGGAYAVLAYVTQAATGPFGWITPAQAVDGLALAETTPGPLIMVVQFVGFMAAWGSPEGLTPAASALVGALVTTFATFLPAIILVLLGAPYIEALRGHRGLDGALGAVTAAVVGVILNLALVFGAAVLLPEGAAGSLDLTAVALAAAAFLVLWRLRVDVVWVVLGGIGAGLLIAWLGG